MVRSVKNPEDRRSEILRISQQLFFMKGYENTSIKDIIDEVGIAKGTFYHHFDSKQALLEAFIGEVLEQSIQLMTPIVSDPNMDALEKFHRLFAEIGNFKLANKQMIKIVLNIWYKDENAVMRDKMNHESLKRVSPLFDAIIRQGVAEGCFSTAYPDDTGEIVLGMGHKFAESLTELLLRNDDNGDQVVGEEGNHPVLTKLARKIAAYEYALEQVLGAAPGTINIIDIEQWEPWFVESETLRTN